MPEHFDVLTKNLANHELATPSQTVDNPEQEPWSRLVYEKPFGYDLTSAEQINACIKQAFHENQIFRIDHYLGKELVGNIALLRFTNRILEPLWNNQHIESVQIILSENAGIGTRGGFYDSYGALKDMVQSHMLQILALVAMEAPLLLKADHIRNAKADVLKKVQVASVIRGQYEGYRDEEKVAADSQTETFVALRCTIDNDRWRGVPFYVKTGKFLDKKEASIHIRFKQVPCLLDVCPSDSNYLTIKINPDEGIYLEINVKVPGVADRVMPVSMDFSHDVMFGPNTPEAYEVLLADVIAHDHSAFVRADEIHYSWKIVEEALSKKGILYTYKKGSKGPSALYLLDQEREIRWRA
jgi:glucose-6-phosphate 1-dehydrogenase